MILCHVPVEELHEVVLVPALVALQEAELLLPRAAVAALLEADARAMATALLAEPLALPQLAAVCPV